MNDLTWIDAALTAARPQAIGALPHTHPLATH